MTRGSPGYGRSGSRQRRPLGGSGNDVAVRQYAREIGLDRHTRTVQAVTVEGSGTGAVTEVELGLPGAAAFGPGVLNIVAPVRMRTAGVAATFCVETPPGGDYTLTFKRRRAGDVAFVNVATCTIQTS